MTTEPKPAAPQPQPGGVWQRFPALQRLRQRLRRVPEVRQLAATDCGAACLAMVLGYHGREVTLDEAREARRAAERRAHGGDVRGAAEVERVVQRALGLALEGARDGRERGEVRAGVDVSDDEMVYLS